LSLGVTKHNAMKTYLGVEVEDVAEKRAFLETTIHSNTAFTKL
jgi:hypothetical protein